MEYDAKAPKYVEKQLGSVFGEEVWAYVASISSKVQKESCSWAGKLWKISIRPMFIRKPENLADFEEKQLCGDLFWAEM